MSGTEHGRALAAIVAALDTAGVRYFVGGSFASVVFGELRTTQDVDLIVEFEVAQVPGLVAQLEPDFFVDEELLLDAIRRRSSCNLIHRQTGFKVDLFLRRDRPFSRVEMGRARSVELLPGVPIRVATAEDCVLSKLEWFDKGGRVSDRQWRDVLGVLKEQRGALDTEHLRRWARELGLSELLERAEMEVPIDPV
jgi:hypothetical protein